MKTTFKPLSALLLITTCLFFAACSDNKGAQNTATPNQATPQVTTSSADFAPPSLSEAAAAHVTFSSETIESQNGIALEGVDYYLMAWCPNRGGFSAEVWDDEGFIVSQTIPCKLQQTTISTALTGQGQNIWIKITGVSGNYPSEGFVEVAPMPTPTP